MAMPLRQSLKLGTFLLKQKLLRRDKFALLVELEPLFACNLKCGGCGKIAQPAALLKQRMPVEQAIAAVDAIRQAKAAGFRVMTNTTFFTTDTPQDVIDVLDYLNDELGVDNMQISPGYAYDKAPDQDHWLGVQQTRSCSPRRSVTAGA